MLPNEQKKSLSMEEEANGNDSKSNNNNNNPICGSHLANPIRGIIFDIGSTIFYATKKTTKLRMEQELQQTLVSHLKWTDEQLQLFNKLRLQIKNNHTLKKLYIGTGCVLDEGWLHEPSVRSFIKTAILEMGSDDISLIDESVFDDAIKSYSNARIDNAEQIPLCIETISSLVYDYGVRVAICSNDRCEFRLRELLKKHKLIDCKLFDIIQISVESGYRKPDTRIVEPILLKWKNEYGIFTKNIVFVGDKLETDILAANRLGLRSIWAQLYDRGDNKYKTRNCPSLNPFLIKSDTYVGCNDSEIYPSLLDFNDNVCHKYNEIMHDYKDLFSILCKMSSNLNDTIAQWKPVTIGILLQKSKIEKWKNLGIFQTNLYRKDVIFKAIDLNLEISKQAPFDILLHKLNWFYFNSKYDNKCAKQLQSFLNFIENDSVKTNLKSFKFEQKNDNNNHHLRYLSGNDGKFMYVTDDPEVGHSCQDRWHCYQTIMNARIKADYQGLKNVSIECPKSMLLTFNDIKQLREKQLNGSLKKENCNDINSILNEIKKMKFPVYFKPKISGKTPTRRYEGHYLYIVPNLNKFVTDDNLFVSLMKNENGDWLLQEYIDHDEGECHKVYNLGYFVFASVNSSTPTVQSLNDKGNTMFIHSSGISSKQSNDQRKRDNLANDEFYQCVAKQLSNAFNMKLFGFDVIFEKKSNRAYVVDVNFMPSFKTVNNLNTILTQYLLFEYFIFMKKQKM